VRKFRKFRNFFGIPHFLEEERKFLDFLFLRKSHISLKGEADEEKEDGELDVSMSDEISDEVTV